MERYMMLLKSYKRMPLELENLIRANVHPIEVKKNEIIQHPGIVNDSLYFIEKGLFHFYDIDKEKQITERFKKEDEFILTMKDVYEPGYSEGIQALEDSIIWRFPGELMIELKYSHPFQLQLNAIYGKEMLSRHDAWRCSNPLHGTVNYDFLCRLSPELLDRVPIPLLANYTSIPEHVFRHLHSSQLKLQMSTKRRHR